ncbi:MAG: hypothetical protein U5K79_21995 [Cyclobacteriaceae bacterium]|nr:hypothetical protein [Cyclobacteriaceae bacterium]
MKNVISWCLKRFSFEDEESFDSLTSKFNRTSDLYTQKVLRTIRMLLHEPFVPLIDTMNDFEKISIINSSDEMIEIRDLKNQIVHEYLPEAVQELVPEVLQKTEVPNRNIERTKAFITNRNWIEIYMNNSLHPINFT